MLAAEAWSSVPQSRSFYFHVFQLLGARPHSSNAFSWCTSDISLENKMQSELNSHCSPSKPGWNSKNGAMSLPILSRVVKWSPSRALQAWNRQHPVSERPAGTEQVWGRGAGGSEFGLAFIARWRQLPHSSSWSAWKLLFPVFPVVRLMWLHQRTWHFWF